MLNEKGIMFHKQKCRVRDRSGTPHPGVSAKTISFKQIIFALLQGVEYKRIARPLKRPVRIDFACKRIFLLTGRFGGHAQNLLILFHNRIFLLF